MRGRLNKKNDYCITKGLILVGLYRPKVFKSTIPARIANISRWDIRPTGKELKKTTKL